MWLPINLIIVSILAIILTGYVYCTFSNVKTAEEQQHTVIEPTLPPSCNDTFLTSFASRVQPLNGRQQPFEQRQQHIRWSSREKVPQSPAAFKISGVDGNSMMLESTPPPSYDNLSVHLSFISKNITLPTYKAERTPPPTYSSVTQTLTGIMY